MACLQIKNEQLYDNSHRKSTQMDEEDDKCAGRLLIGCNEKLTIL